MKSFIPILIASVLASPFPVQDNGREYNNYVNTGDIQIKCTFMKAMCCVGGGNSCDNNALNVGNKDYLLSNFCTVYRDEGDIGCNGQMDDSKSIKVNNLHDARVLYQRARVIFYQSSVKCSHLTNVCCKDGVCDQHDKQEWNNFCGYYARQQCGNQPDKFVTFDNWNDYDIYGQHINADKND